MPDASRKPDRAHSGRRFARPRAAEEIGRDAARVAARGSPPSLRILLVGEDPASIAYIASKTRAAREAGCLADTVRLPATAPPERVIEEIERANRDESVDGILVQLPLPPGHETTRVFDALDPTKDVDGVHPENVGRLVQGRPRFVPCTAAGILALLDAAGVPIAGANAAVLGRSEIVGKPVSALLTSRDATVTLCHSRSKDLPSIGRRADILVVAIGRPGFVTRSSSRKGLPSSTSGSRGSIPWKTLPSICADPPVLRRRSPRRAARSSATSTSKPSSPSPAGSPPFPEASAH